MYAQPPLPTPGTGLPPQAEAYGAATASTKRLFNSPPQSVSMFIAALLEPVIAIAMLVAVQIAHEQTIDRACLLLCILTLALVYPGANRFHERPLNVVVDTMAAWAAVVAILFLCGVATRSVHFFDRSVLVWWAVLTPVAQIAAVWAGRSAMRVMAASPEARKPALVIGAGPIGDKVARMLANRQAYGHDFIGHLEDRDVERCAPGTRGRIVGRFSEAADIITRLGIKEVYITLPLSSQPRIARMLAQLQDSAVSIYFVPDVFGVNIIQGRMRNMDGLPVVSLLESPFIGVNRIVKRVSDIVLASIILVLITPMLAAVAIGVKLSSPGPIIFKQRRNGVDGGEILVYKFRSMRATDNGAVVKQATRGDPRITPFGAFIRRTSLDELPQFINVLQGRMSIVGPRPHAVAHNDQYRRIIHAYMLRHKVKPGITGWAQVNGCRGETDAIEKMEARVAYDIEYLRNWSLGMDLRIIARTIKLTFFDKNAY
ncbi:putative colanic acid biosynthesis UDP-glucose lipid carrier transferase [Sphaerotilus hippei]|uniref:Putative colanic acid biosynthesis UDP-glucose lipid carrier transferase n=1 Tax=Sphaerotilus hippei TaxID=744406 RepID=A0A318H9B0_9BURK|nr:undecaprenyl-phosphate glucose phosphotransferase [Sphaerotilus hippei]PXW94930.1 putative colanic acid biosynthesis UDP-glucose lipid carrier transferase [Sphaerotilus hippei]